MSIKKIIGGVLLLITVLSLLTACARAPFGNLTERSTVKSQSNIAPVPLANIDLAAIGHIAPKGRVQDFDYSDLPVVKSLLQHGKESVPFLISKLDSETKIEGPVMDYWNEVRVGDVALIILTDFFTDSTWQHTTLPGIGWDEFLERGSNKSLTSEKVLRNYISKHGRKEIKDRWQTLWGEHADRVIWDENQRCFTLTAKE